MTEIENFTEHYKWLRAQEATKENPVGLIQWKGTDVCIDIHCSCGNHCHIDDYFVYYFKCHCGKIYALDHTIKLIELDETHTKYVEQRSPNVIFHSCVECEGGNKTKEISPERHEVQCNNPKCNGQGYYKGERPIDPNDPTVVTVSIPIQSFKVNSKFFDTIEDSLKQRIGTLPKEQIIKSLKNLTKEDRKEIFREFL